MSILTAILMLKCWKIVGWRTLFQFNVVFTPVDCTRLQILSPSTVNIAKQKVGLMKKTKGLPSHFENMVDCGVAALIYFRVQLQNFFGRLRLIIKNWIGFAHLKLGTVIRTRTNLAHLALVMKKRANKDDWKCFWERKKKLKKWSSRIQICKFYSKITL